MRRSDSHLFACQIWKRPVQWSGPCSAHKKMYLADAAETARPTLNHSIRWIQNVHQETLIIEDNASSSSAMYLFGADLFNRIFLCVLVFHKKFDRGPISICESGVGLGLFTVPFSRTLLQTYELAEVFMDGATLRLAERFRFMATKEISF